MPNVLIVDDEPMIVDVIRERLEAEGFAVRAVMDSAGVRGALQEFQPDLALVDVLLGPESGLEVLREIRRERPGLSVIIMTGQPTSELCLEAMQLGADKFIRKPLDLDELAQLAQRLTVASPAAPNEPFVEEKFVGKSQAVLDLIQNLWKAAQSEADTLILGQNGTGKDLAARMIHGMGPRSQKPFYTIYLPAVTDTLFESELFGTEPGAFNEAKSRKGRVEEAEGGVLLLNEIGDLKLEQQVKLLEFLDGKNYVRVGGTAKRHADVQILVCTNRDLEEKVQDKTFREDLFHRLRSNVVRLPLLRERPEDIPDLCSYLIMKNRGKKKVQTVEPELLLEFQRLSWEGNVRALEKCLMQGIVNCLDSTIRRTDIPDLRAMSAGALWSSPDLNQDITWDEFQSQLDQLACQFLRDHLQQHHGNIAEAARRLGISRETLNYKIRTLGLKDLD